GGLRYQAGTMPTSFGFTGLRSDPSGLVVTDSRFYDPVAGQFTSADDALPSGGAILGGLNRYAYVTGNPETLTDATGHWPDILDHAIKTVTNVVQAVAPAVAHVVQAAAPVVGAVLDGALGISDMVNDVKTLFNPNASWQDKFGSIVNLGFNAFMDATTVIGVGEGLKAAYVGVKAGLEIGAKFAGKEAVEMGEREAAELAAKEGGELGEKGAGDALEDVCKVGNSFEYTTPVATPAGQQAIGTLKVGDKVLALDAATGKTKVETVQHVFINHDDNLLDVTLAADTKTQTKPQDVTASAQKQQDAALASHGSQAPPTQEVLHTTTEHPFLTAELGWVNAQDLKAGEHVRRADGSLGVVVGTKVVAGEAVRYNLTVEEDHTYFVGVGRWVVHNCGRGFDRTIEDTKDLDPNLPDTLTKNPDPVQAGRSGAKTPKTGIPNSYSITTGGEHAIVYDQYGERIYDISSKRVKMTVFSMGPDGTKYWREIKLAGSVPSEWLRLLS
nr:hypothetical protein [Ktedonobacterales bacterium]